MMRDNQNKILKSCSLLILLLLISVSLLAQQASNESEIDKKVKAFLDSKKSEWRYWNVPFEDGKLLYELILKNKYTSGLEIGTSTGHSTIWMAWAMSKTGGKVITIEIDEGRYKTAIDNIEKAGLSEFVDARLADAHEEVKKLPGPFDFVFSDADKGWYTQYFKDVDPKLKVGGCFTAHNVSNSFGGADEFVRYVEKLPNYNTTIDRTSSSGVSISYKKSQ
jgi:predicted O-methyltransferase YrrM